MIASIEAGDFSIAELMLRQPMTGPWRARIKIPSDSVVEGESVTLSDDSGNEWVGVARGVVPSGPSTIIDVVAGAGALDSLTTEQFYAGGIAIAALLAELCEEVGESADETIGDTLAQWRSRGGSLRRELDRLARFTTGAWRVVPGGLVSLSVASGEADPPGRFIEERSGARSYETSAATPVAGLDVNGWRIGVALWERSAMQPLRATLWRSDPARVAEPPGTVGARVTGGAGGRVDVVTDTGLAISDLPLWSAVGVEPEPTPGSRVLVLDLAGDPRASIALSGVYDGDVSSLSLADGDVPLAMAGVVEALEAFASASPSGGDGGLVIHTAFKAAWNIAKQLKRVQSEKVTAK